MSTKTISKRVALATVVALGAGVLSLVSVSSASAIDTMNKITASSTNKTTLVAGTLYMATAASTTGAASASIESTNGPTTTAPSSLGLLNVSDTVGNDTPIAGTTQTATLLASGKLNVYEKIATSGAIDSIVVSGATLTIPTTATAIVVNNTATAAQETAASNNTYWGVTITPNAGVSSFTVSLYTGNTTGIANATTGTLSGFITVSIGSTTSSGTVSATKSAVLYETGTAGAPATWAYSTSSVTGAKNDSNASTTGTSSYGNLQAALVTLKDAYGVNLQSGYVTATATNGAAIGWTSGSTAGTTQSSTATVGTGYFAIDATAVTNGYVHMLVSNPTTAPLSTTVTVSVNGVVIGTKAFTFTGRVAKVTLSSPSNGYLSSSSNTVYAYFYDAAGNAVAPGNTTSIGYSSYPLQLTQNANTAGTGIGLGAYSSWTSAAPTINWKCGASSATGNLAVDYTNPDGSVVTSNGVAVSCSDSPVTYTAAFDKSTYNSGDIATLTVTFKDKNGSLAADRGSTYTSNAAPSIYGSNLTGTTGTSTTAGTTSDATTNGVIKYKFIVGSTAGSYAAVVDFSTVDSAATTAGLTQSALAVPYSIASSGTSLNDVLKGIVALIASINKQIAALAKLVTKK
jgi:trimeric autotransporter adhesin